MRENPSEQIANLLRTALPRAFPPPDFCSMELLLSDRAENLSGTYFYCMEDRVCTKFSEVSKNKRMDV
ncbi:hypothetical protein niasHT_011619 [Heterodera trifolii]|uniref:Uncharacterized protein n=1 Tax=Heterodera trifolii TaxID=157864 RepID=A0ABD2LIJ1_9BILA